MSRSIVREQFLKSIADITDGTTIKVVKGDKTLIEIDGDLVSKVMNVVETFDRMEEMEG